MSWSTLIATASLYTLASLGANYRVRPATGAGTPPDPDLL